MKVFAVLLIAALCATAICAPAEEPEQQLSMKESLVAKAKELQAKVNQALEAAKSKGAGAAKEIAKVLGEKKEQALARLQNLQAELQAKLKELKEMAGPITDKAKKLFVERAMVRIQQVIKQLQALEDKLSKAQ